jgi:hypothetical protein
MVFGTKNKTKKRPIVKSVNHPPGHEFGTENFGYIGKALVATVINETKGVYIREKIGKDLPVRKKNQNE